jgi:hypothetical protein
MGLASMGMVHSAATTSNQASWLRGVPMPRRMWPIRPSKPRLINKLPATNVAPA